jgi:hypothetical protein
MRARLGRLGRFPSISRGGGEHQGDVSDVGRDGADAGQDDEDDEEETDDNDDADDEGGSGHDDDKTGTYIRMYVHV